MDKNFPISLNLDGNRVVIIGGGKISERKVNTLLGTGAKITVVSPEITSELKEMYNEQKIVWKRKNFSPDDIDNAFLIIAATNNNEVNRSVKNSAKKNQLVSLVDNPDESNFHIPAVLRRGKLVISVSTSGASPSFAKKVRSQLEKIFDESYEDYMDFLFEARKFILKNIKDPIKREALLKEIANESYLKNNNPKELFQSILEHALEYK